MSKGGNKIRFIRVLLTSDSRAAAFKALVVVIMLRKLAPQTSRCWANCLRRKSEGRWGEVPKIRLGTPTYPAS